MRFGLLFIAVLLVFTGNSKDKKYPAGEIPQEMRDGAHAVVRSEYIEFRVQDASSAILVTKKAVTVLNEHGRNFAYFFHHYFGKSSDLVSFKGTVYNSQGEEIAKIKKSDLKDRSLFDGFSVYSESRYLSAQYQHHDFPYTVEYETTEKYDAMMFYPRWDPQRREMLSVQSSEFNVYLPVNMELRYKEMNLKEQVTVNDQGGIKHYHWQVNGIPAVNSDLVGELWHELTPKVLTGPNEFTFGGYRGDMSSWKSYGKWQQKLNRDLGEVPEETLLAIKKLVADAPNKKEATRRIYKYLQENTRYVSIQLGIGGWQPFPPSMVDDTGYGDCKALSYYTQSMLKSVGIESLYTLVNAGRSMKNIYTDFPSDQFNHVFLCVPLGQDTVWLECTSQTNPFGYLGTFTSDRPVLLITEEGGKMVRTPAMSLEQSQKITNAQVKIAANGSADIKLSTHHQGYFSETISRRLLPLGLEEQKKWLYNNLELPTYTINDHQFSKIGDEIPVVLGEMNISLRKAASVSGKRLFLQPNLMNRWEVLPAVHDDRQTDFLIRYNKVWSDTLTYVLPEGFHPEFIPEAVLLEEKFGSYHYHLMDQAGTLKFVRRLELRKGRYQPEYYQKYREFLQQVQKADKAKVVFKNTT